jgi:hypothetical protein
VDEPEIGVMMFGAHLKLFFDPDPNKVLTHKFPPIFSSIFQIDFTFPIKIMRNFSRVIRREKIGHLCVLVSQLIDPLAQRRRRQFPFCAKRI